MEKALKIEWPQGFGIRISLWIRSGHKTHGVENGVEIPLSKTEARKLTETQAAYVYRVLQIIK